MRRGKVGHKKLYNNRSIIQLTVFLYVCGFIISYTSLSMSLLIGKIFLMNMNFLLGVIVICQNILI